MPKLDEDRGHKIAQNLSKDGNDIAPVIFTGMERLVRSVAADLDSNPRLKYTWYDEDGDEHNAYWAHEAANQMYRFCIEHGYDKAAGKIAAAILGAKGGEEP